MDVDVVITNKPGGGYDYALDANGKSNVQEIKLENEKRPGVMVYFNIRDDAGSGYTFQPVPSNALWVRYSNLGNPLPPACPTAASKWSKFVPLSVEEDKYGKNTQLIVYCRNLQQQKFRFALRLVDSNGVPVPDYDPIGDGANGLRR
jgi:hypothetical protein